MQARGIFLTVLSAVLYGLNPLFSKTINVGGCNSLTQTFARLAAGIVIFSFFLYAAEAAACAKAAPEPAGAQGYSDLLHRLRAHRSAALCVL